MSNRLSIVYMSGTAKAATIADIDVVLALREEGDMNDFYLSPTSAPYPALKILVRGYSAHVTFFPSEDVPGVVAVGVPVSAALSAARQFFRTLEQPQALTFM